MEEREAGSLWAADVDLDQDGQLDRVAKYMDGLCDYFRAWGSAVVALKDKTEVIDTQETERLPWMDVQFDVFLYKHRAFLEEWVGEGERPFLTIYQLKGGKTHRLCRLRYRKR